jgi:alkylation response protein AidB-like acyl-CoA dehydrogenase
MDLTYADEDLAFKAQIEDFCEAHVSAETRRKIALGHRLSKADIVDYHRVLYDHGYAVPNWKKEWGGTDWTSIQHQIFDDVTAAYDCPRRLAFGVSMVGPVLQAFGSREQQEKYLPRIARLDDWWCQGFSEPGSGSDLASLKTTAVRDGDEYVINGQKTWTTYAQHADMMFILTRTDSECKPQEGISFMVLDMKTPGITVKPIILLDGYHEVNEVFFDDVRIPVENLVGEENKGWDYAKFLLAHERFGIAQIGFAKNQLDRLKDIAAQEKSEDGTPLSQDVFFSQKVAEIEMDLTALEVTNLRVLSDKQNQSDLTFAGMLKIRGSDLNQKLTRLIMETVGPAAAVEQQDLVLHGRNEPPLGPEYAGGAAPSYLNNRKLSIFGGSNEIQRTIIAKAMLTA